MIFQMPKKGGKRTSKTTKFWAVGQKKCSDKRGRIIIRLLQVRNSFVTFVCQQVSRDFSFHPFSNKVLKATIPQQTVN